MIKYWLIYFICCINLAAKGQDVVTRKSIDKKTVQLAEDTMQINSLLRAASSYRKNDPQKALEYTNSAIKLAEKIAYKEGLINSYIEKKKCYFWLNQYQKSIEAAEKALGYAKEINKPYWLIETNFNLANSYFTVSDNVKALRHHLEALKHAEKMGVNYRLLDIYNAMGVIYFREKNYSKAMEYYQKELNNILKEMNVTTS